MPKDHFHIITANVDVLMYIFGHLNFGDQLRLACVNKTLQLTFKRYIWRENYECLTLAQSPPNFIVCNETECNKLNLNTQEFDEFLTVYSHDIRSWCEIKGLVDASRLLTNLTSLSYFQMIITADHLDLVADSCKHLEKLKLHCCVNSKQRIIILGSKDLRIKTLLRMITLTHFTLVNSLDSEVEFKYIRELISKMDLEYLQLNAKIIPDELNELPPTTLDKKGEIYSINPIKYLKIFTSFQPFVCFSNLSTYLRIFENLTLLSLRCHDKLNTNSLKIISETCKLLQRLTIELTIFEHIEDFSIPARLKHLSLFCCKGLSYRNLRQLLTQFQLIEFSSVHTNYQGIFQDFTISSTLESLDIDAVCTPKFPSAYKDNAHLKELTWYDDVSADGTQYDPVNLYSFNCKHLAKFTIKSGYIPLKSIFELKSLCVLKLPQSIPGMSWSYIADILRDSGIREFHLSDVRVPRELAKSAVPPAGFECTVQYVKIPLVVFSFALDFWLDLRAKSPDMELECLTCNSHSVDQSKYFRKFLAHMIKSSKFPHHIESIQICGFNVDCKALRTNVDAALENINPKNARIRFPTDIFSIRL